MNLTRLISAFALGVVCSIALVQPVSAQFREASVAAPSLTPGNTFKSCQNCPSMVVVPPGTYKKGSERVAEGRALPIRDITIAKPFAIAQTEITNAQFAEYWKETPEKPPSMGCLQANEHGINESNPFWDWDDIEADGGTPPNFPARCINWHYAKGYVEWLAKKTGLPYRLTNEAEWEYVAKAGKNTDWFWGNDLKRICEYENGLDQTAQKAGMPTLRHGEPMLIVPCEDGVAALAPVGSKKPNPFGVYDMSGSVWEWQEDCWAQPVPAAPVDGSAYEVEHCRYRVIKGASYRAGYEEMFPFWRGRNPTARAVTTYGFRVALDLTPR
ncbi:MAG: SUMF1/EgtB/PvdO family nonheme iron enzyme [Steroidobacteraceae bacterium]